VKSHDIALRGIDHLMRDLQHALLGHSLEVDFPVTCFFPNETKLG
jgi:hypothetical protein